jgi:hypothetical protein
MIASGPSFRLDRHPDPATMSDEWARVDDSTELPSEWDYVCAPRWQAGYCPYTWGNQTVRVQG